MKVTFQIEGASPVTIECNQGDNLLELARRANVAIDAPCSGNGSCGKCRVKLIEGELETIPSRHITAEEYEAGWRLSCNCKVASDCVEIFACGEEQLLGEASVEASGNLVGEAFVVADVCECRGEGIPVYFAVEGRGVVIVVKIVVVDMKRMQSLAEDGDHTVGGFVHEACVANVEADNEGISQRIGLRRELLCGGANVGADLVRAITQNAPHVFNGDFDAAFFCHLAVGRVEREILFHLYGRGVISEPHRMDDDVFCAKLGRKLDGAKGCRLGLFVECILALSVVRKGRMRLMDHGAALGEDALDALKMRGAILEKERIFFKFNQGNINRGESCLNGFFNRSLKSETREKTVVERK